ncbi:hypothetical protein EDD21DRAFT_129435 [Dissophora ornata]|nr:hypothetical protein EDD21DRAFT_129435 [Dissophora ornata]
MEEYEKRIEEMTRQLVLWETEQSKMLELQHQMETIVGRWQSAELLLAAEKEEARTLRNRVSQQSQTLDDMRIQMAMNEGYGPENMPKTPSIEHHSEEEGHENDEEGDGKENGLRLKTSHDSDSENIANHDRSLGRAGDSAERARSLHRKASSSLRHHSSVLEMNWPTTFNRSNSSQQGFEQQRRAAAMQEFVAREKDRWDQELQESHNRWSKEAMRNQLLEDRILELQGQLEIARAIDMRHQSFTSGNQGGHNGGRYGGNGGGISGGEGHGLSRMMDAPAQPQNMPSARITGPGSGMMMMHDHFGEVDTDDGAESGEMIGRYSRRRHETEDDDDIMQPRTRSANASPPHGSTSASHNPASSTGKGKSAKSKSRSKWLQGPATHERAQTDRGTYGPGIAGSGAVGMQSHLGSNLPGILDFGRGLVHQRKSGESSSTAGSSTAAARAAFGGLVPPLHYARNMSHISDGGSSDVTTGSDGSTAGGTSGAGVAGDGDAGNTSVVSDSKSGSVSGSTTSQKSGKSKAERERDRERERIRLMSGTGPLADPSKMYRNVRMF